VAVLLAVVTGYALIDGFENARFEVANPTTTAQVSDSIFSDYIVPFEAASVLLLAALIGAIVVARKD
jgi:NADH-quinone oxidoreductase subunit J